MLCTFAAWIWVEGLVEVVLGFSGGSVHHSSHLPTVPLCSNVQGDSQTGICITIEPGLLLKGDILVRIVHSAPGIGNRQGLGGRLA